MTDGRKTHLEIEEEADFQGLSDWAGDPDDLAQEVADRSFPDAYHQQDTNLLSRILRVLAPILFAGMLIWFVALVLLG